MSVPSQSSDKSIIPVSLLFKDYGRNGTSCQLVNKNTLWIQSMIRSVKSANVSHYVVQRVSGSRSEQYMVYVPHSECSCLMLFLLLLMVVQNTHHLSPEHSGT
jgi:hypothetical protein